VVAELEECPHADATRPIAIAAAAKADVLRLMIAA
jgi:hypothetical protein